MPQFGALYFPAEPRPGQTQVLVNRPLRTAEFLGVREQIKRRKRLPGPGIIAHGIRNGMGALFPEEGHGTRHVRSFRHQDEWLLPYDGRDRERLGFRITGSFVKNHISTVDAKLPGDLGHHLSDRGEAARRRSS